MIPERFVIHIAGPSCAGKSSIFTALLEKLPDTYTVSYDKMKWQMSHYHRDKHRAIINELGAGLFEVVCAKHIPVLLDSFIKDEDEYAHYKEIAERHGYVFLSVELTAPMEVLLARFRDRIEIVKREGRKISVMDEETFIAQTSKRPFVHEGTPVFDTSQSDKETIAEDIIRLLSSGSREVSI